MSVTSYLALYVTLLGWEQYQNLWGMVTGTGLIYLPFIGIILKSTMVPFTSMGAKPACQIALRRLVISILGALLVIFFAAIPAVHLNPKVLHFEPMCVEGAQQVTPGHTGTTYDNIFPVPTGVKVPILWYLVMAVSNGFTHAASLGLGCSAVDYRSLHTELNLAHIENPELKKEAAQFYADCYIPAYSKYLSSDVSEAQKAEIRQYLNRYGQEDLSWLGSQALLNVPGFYSAFQASKPVEGFPFDPSRDAEEGQIGSHSKWGEPSCTDWWKDSGNGLHQKLGNALPPGVVKRILHLGQKTAELEDSAIKTLIDQSMDNESMKDYVRGYESLDDNASGDYISRYAGAPLGVLLHNLTFAPKIHLLINALPIIQGSLLFAIYVFLALAIPFSSYRMEFCVMGMFVIFSLIFCSYIWHLVAWFDHFLIEALYPDLYGVAGMGGILSNVSHGTNVMFVNMITGTLYVVLPIFWMMVMSWAGFQAGHFLSSAMGSMMGPAEASGGEAGSMGKTAIRSGASSVL